MRMHILCIALLPVILFPPQAESKERLVNTGYHTFPNAMPGKELITKKMLDSATGKIIYASDNAEISTPDAFRNLLLQERALERKKFGALGEGLRDKIEKLKDWEYVKVKVFFKYPEASPLPSKLDHSMEYLENHSKQLLKVKPVTTHEEFSWKHGLNNPLGVNGRNALYEMPKSKLKKIMFDKDVASIEEHFEPKPLTKSASFVPFLFAQGGNPSLAALATSAYNHSTSPVPSLAGSQINAATFESGLTQGFLNCINVTPIAWDANPFHDDRFRHTLETFRCLTHAAPSARFHHRRSTTYNGQDDVSWIVNNAIQSSSMSVERRWNGPTDEENRVMDNFAYTWPYTVFVNPAGNDGWDLEVAWQPYNAISVGNVQHHLYNTFHINACGGGGGCTATRNPFRRYGGPCRRAADNNYTYCSSDRELPHLIIPGFPPSSDLNPPCSYTGMRENCSSPFDIFCGTSLSAPIGNGIAAAVLAADGRMLHWPEKVRAALLLTAENVDGNEWSNYEDGRDGVGVINGASAVAFAQSHSTASSGLGAVQKGLGVGSLQASNWNTVLQYNIAIPNPVPSGKILRVILTWDSNPSLNSSINELSDLDLVVNGTVTKSSSSYDSNVEVVHLTPSQVQAGGTAVATISKYANRIPTNATTDFFYYAIAWDWVDQHAP